MKTFLLVGANSAIAKACNTLLQDSGAQTIGLSRGNLDDFNTSFQVVDYTKENLPVIEGPIDGLVYFPGTINLKPFHRISREEFTHDFNINAMGAVEVLQTYLPNLKKGQHPSVVLLSSVAAQTGLPFHASISMAKAAIEGLTMALAAEWAPSIRVNAVAPSLTDSPLSERFLSTPEKTEAAKNRNPMKKVGSPQEIAEAICFLLNDSSSWMTGQVLTTDGGYGKLRL
jgi:NAD(P)-dependent dehydrogenase (short-subunit alcohol dehydrogenase family)